MPWFFTAGSSWEQVPDPVLLESADVIVRVDAVTICGTDLHIRKGDVPEMAPGRILGHEAVGIDHDHHTAMVITERISFVAG